MSDPVRCTPSAIAPARRTRGGWNQALLGAASAASPHLVLDLTGPDRVETALLACLAPVEQDLLRRNGSLRVDALDRELRTALWLGGMGRLLLNTGANPGDLSCSVVYSDDEVRIAIHRSAPANPHLNAPISHMWLGRVQAKRVVVDMADIGHVNSVMVAWLLQIGQMARPGETALVNVSRQASIQLNQLRLNHLLQVQTAE